MFCIFKKTVGNEFVALLLFLMTFHKYFNVNYISLLHVIKHKIYNYFIKMFMIIDTHIDMFIYKN